MPEALVKTVAAILLALCATVSTAKEAAAESADPALEARMSRITAELRCLVCQNQTIADSNASLAVDLRRETRELLRQGKSDREVVDYMTARYGDFVLYRPPLKTTTFLLWFGPSAMLVVGATVLLVVLRRRTKMAAGAFEPDDDEGDADAEADANPEPAGPGAAASRR
ncbi:MAG: cytochrome c-type biogenesis protein [Caldimonas sp.]